MALLARNQTLGTIEHSGHLHTDGHEHHHDHAAALGTRALRLAFFLTTLILVVEVVGGFVANSLALLSDAGHAVTDVFALGLAWFASAQAARKADERNTFGYQRVGILAAFANALLLILVAGFIVFEASGRLVHPEPLQPVAMFVSAGVGIALNLFIALKLHGAGGHSLNVRSAALHVLGDIAASLGVVIAGVVILLTGQTIADPILSVGIALIIAVGAFRLVREATGILMEATPRGLSVASVVRDLCTLEGVEDVHDLHIWSISSGVRALSCHAVIADLPPSGSAPILDRISQMLTQKYHIEHTTIQFESSAHQSHEGHCACKGNTLYCNQC